MSIVVFPGVYHTSADTELMIDAVQIGPAETFHEVGCGTGAVSAALGKRCLRGVASDVNARAVLNARENFSRLQVDNVAAVRCDVFDGVAGRFDIVLFNPPYMRYAAEDDVERMFWDPEDLAKRRFFAQARRHLRPGGRVYVGWADFADLEHDLPDVLAREGGLRKVREHRRPSPNGKCTFIVYEYTSDGAADPLTEWET